MNHLRRLFALVCALCALCCLLPAHAIEIPEPTLSPEANKYDPEQPELLYEDQLYAASAILIEASTGQVIFEKNADQIMYPASTTKILTALLALEFGDLDEMCTVSQEAITFYEDDVTTIDLRAGEQIPLRELLYAALVKSANDAANVIAEAISGDMNTFVGLMNQAASIYGCTNTNFTNPNGLHNDNHYTTARDMALLAMEAMKNETFREMVATTSYSIPATDVMRSRGLVTSNRLMIAPTAESANKYYFPEAIGIKTGTTTKAGYCFVGAAERDGVELISVLFFTGENARWADTIKLMNYGFSQYVSVTPIDLYNMNPITVETKNFSLEDTNLGKLPLTCVAKDPTNDTKIIARPDEVDLMASNLKDTMLFEYSREFTAPITAGEVMGTMTYFPETGEPVEYNLLAARSIEKRANAPKTLEEIVAETEADPNPFPPFTFEMGMYIAVPVIALYILIRVLKKITHRRRVRNARMPKPTSRYLK